MYTVTDFKSGNPGIVTCLSCGVRNTRGGDCNYNSFEFSADNSYYTMSCKVSSKMKNWFLSMDKKKIAIIDL